jgi:hypothetical protein
LVDQKGRLGRKQIMMKPDSDHFFNEDLEQLLESLEDKDTDGDETLDELSFLFEQTSPPAAGYGTSLDQTLSSLPLEPELAELLAIASIGKKPPLMIFILPVGRLPSQNQKIGMIWNRCC